jgi:hypothetical protein
MININESDIFKTTRLEAKSLMESTIMEGVMIPSREQWQRKAAPAEVTATARKDTRTWLERLIRSEYRREPEPGGAWSIINGQDALIGSWTMGQQVIQVIVTRSRVHIRTKLPIAIAIASDVEKIAAAVALGRQLFGLGSESAALAKTARRLGDLAYAAPEPMAQKGFRTSYLIVTDGVSVKYSFVKLNSDPAEIKGHSLVESPRPWFGVRPRAVS